MKKASDIKPQGPVKYLWRDRFPIGCISVVAGIEGTGKSTLLASIAAEVSGKHGVIVSSQEDSDNQTRSRIEAAGGKLDKVFFPEGQYLFPRDADQLANDIHTSKAKLAVFDAASQHLPHLASETAVRRALEPLAYLAEQEQLAIIFVAHTLRSARRGQDIRQCIQGPALTRAARCLALYGQRPEMIPGLFSAVSNRRALAFIKDSYRPLPQGLLLRMESVKVRGADIARIEVEGDAYRLDPYQLLAMPEGRKAA